MYITDIVINEKNVDKTLSRQNDRINKIDLEIDKLKNYLNKKGKIIYISDTTTTIEPNIVYLYEKANPISELNITLAEAEKEIINEYTVKFIANVDDMVLRINSSSEIDLKWHNEPKILKDKIYTLSISVAGQYQEAVLSYAE